MRVAHNLGKRQTAANKERVRAGIARAQAAGKHFGNTRRHHVNVSDCETCGTRFKWAKNGEVINGQKIAVKQRTGRFCSKKCLVEWLHKYQSILPHADEIARLYWDEGLSLWDIARKFNVTDQATVKKAMARAGIPRRPNAHVGKKICIVDMCNQPTFKLKHPSNGSLYGRRCQRHWVEHRTKLKEDYSIRRSKARGFRDQVLEALMDQLTTTPDIVKRTGLSTKTVSNTLSHMHKNGLVQKVGRYRARVRGGGWSVIWRLADGADNKPKRMAA